MKKIETGTNLFYEQTYSTIHLNFIYNILIVSVYKNIGRYSCLFNKLTSLNTSSTVLK